MKTIEFKCEFGGRDGWGHVMRCSALAASFIESGWRTHLWTRSGLSGLPEEVALQFSSSSEKSSKEASLLVVDEMYTADGELSALVSEWKALHSSGLVMGVDDMQRRKMAAFDWVLNSEIGLDNARYESANCLLGERFALLRRGFEQPASLDFVEGNDKLCPVLVMLGGTDPFGLMPKVLEELKRYAKTRFAPVVIAGESSAAESALKGFERSKWVRHASASEVAGWMRVCRFAVLACGTSLLEAAAMKIPFVGICLVDNQVATAKKVEQLWRMPIVYRQGRDDQVLELGPQLDQVLSLEHFLYGNVDTRGANRVRDSLLACF